MFFLRLGSDSANYSLFIHGLGMLVNEGFQLSLAFLLFFGFKIFSPCLQAWSDISR